MEGELRGYRQKSQAKQWRRSHCVGQVLASSWESSMVRTMGHRSASGVEGRQPEVGKRRLRMKMTSPVTSFDSEVWTVTV